MVSGVSAIQFPPRPSRSSSAVAKPRDRDITEFIYGPENCVAPVAACRFLHQQQSLCNPLVICGPSGSGKSHFARGLAAAWKAANADGVLVELEADELGKQKRQVLDHLLYRRQADEARATMFVVENLEAIAAKSPLQNILRTILDEISLCSESCIVVTACKLPDAVSGLCSALRSRLSSGLVFSLAAPERATRSELLKQYASILGIELDDPAAEHLSAAETRSTGQLIERLIALKHGGYRQIDAALLADSAIASVRSRTLKVDRVASVVARYFSLKKADLTGRSRRRAVAHARCIAMYLARQMCDTTLNKIGRVFGNRDHTTVIHSCRNIEKQRKDQSIEKSLCDLQQILNEPP